jgi:GntR family transcriptional regulator / MocR family aminotransferase
VQQRDAQDDGNVAPFRNDQIVAEPQDNEQAAERDEASYRGGPEWRNIVHEELRDRPVDAPGNDHDRKQAGGNARRQAGIHRVSLNQFPPANMIQTGSRQSARLEKNKVPVSEPMVAGMIELKRSGVDALVAQLTNQLRCLISNGRLGRNGKLPSSRRLAADLGVSRNTVSHALEQLVAEGYLDISRGRRAVVIADSDERFAVVPSTAAVRAAEASLSPWASRLKQVDWPMSYQADLRPLRPGLADAREFPNEVWARCLRRSALHAGKRHPLSVNRPRLRDSLKHYLETSRGVRAEMDQIIVLPTAQAALTLIAATLVSPGDRVWIEDPGYPGAAAAFRASGARVIGVGLDGQGMRRAHGRTAPKLVFLRPLTSIPPGG